MSKSLGDGTTQSVIARLEEGGDTRNRRDTLDRVASALGRHLIMFSERHPARRQRLWGDVPRTPRVVHQTVWCDRLLVRRYGGLVGVWTASELDDLIEPVLVDAYNDDEQLTAFETAFTEVTFPITASLLGRTVAVREVVFDSDVRRGLRAVVVADGHTANLDLLDLVFIADVPGDTGRLVTAYRRWWAPVA